jgi:hypothetical protein
MPLTLSGTNGVSGIDGSAGTPTERGSDADTGVFYPSAGNIAISTNGTEALRVDSSQNVGIGRNNPGGYAKLAISFSAADATNNNTGLGLDVTTATSGAIFVQFYNNSGAGIGSISRNGATNAILYNTSSDYRLKEQIAPITDGLQKTLALKPSKWVWKDCDGQAGEGFIAHEVQAIVPSAVTGEKDAVDDGGKPKYQGIDASYLVATLTAAIQELSAKNDALEARIAALEAN